MAGTCAPLWMSRGAQAASPAVAGSLPATLVESDLTEAAIFFSASCRKVQAGSLRSPRSSAPRCAATDAVGDALPRDATVDDASALAPSVADDASPVARTCCRRSGSDRSVRAKNHRSRRPPDTAQRPPVSPTASRRARCDSAGRSCKGRLPAPSSIRAAEPGLAAATFRSVREKQRRGRPRNRTPPHTAPAATSFPRRPRRTRLRRER